MSQRRWRRGSPVDIARTLRPLARGAGDPTMRFVDGRWWLGCRTPAGLGTVAIGSSGDEIVAEAWGDGAGWLLDSAPGLVGEDDDWSRLDVSGYPVLQDVRRRLPGVRLCRSAIMLPALVPACLEQRVTGQEAWRAWRQLVGKYGDRAPMSPLAGSDLLIAPSAESLLAVPEWDWHLFGVDGKRYRAIRAVAHAAAALQRCSDVASAERVLALIPGIGPWTAAEATLRTFGNPDAVSVGDFHLKNLVGFVLTGSARTDDDTMVRLLEPWRGQRARIIRLIELSGHRPPKFGPRFSPNDISRL